MSLFSRTDQSFLGRWWWTIDRGLLAVLLVIMAFGVVLVAAASPPVAERIGLNEYYFLRRHLVFLGPAFCFLLAVSFLSAREILYGAAALLAVSLVGMVLTLIVGIEVKGAQRWLSVLGFSVQPSEFVKPAFVVVAAWLIARQKTDPGFAGMKAAAGVYIVVLVLLILQPDMGMSAVVTACFGAVLFLAGMKFRLVFMLAGMVFIAGLAAYFTLPHVQSRVDRFFDPGSGDTYQVDRSLEAFKSGGVFGVGPGQGEVKLTLPDAHADFIFSVAGEELGLVFVVVLIAMYGYVLVRASGRIAGSDDMFALLAGGGLLTMFGLQALIHMGSSLQLLPAKGMTLPFVSYGGSSLLAMALAMGAVLALTRRQARAGIARGGLSLQSGARRARHPGRS